MNLTAILNNRAVERRQTKQKMRHLIIAEDCFLAIPKKNAPSLQELLAMVEESVQHSRGINVEYLRRGCGKTTSLACYALNNHDKRPIIVAQTKAHLQNYENTSIPHSRMFTWHEISSRPYASIMGSNPRTQIVLVDELTTGEALQLMHSLPPHIMIGGFVNGRSY